MAGYVPIATIAKLGGVIPDGTSIFVTADGVISADPAQLIPIPGTEGDLYYFHAGAVHVLHIDSAGKVLTSDGTDPHWAETVMPMAANGVVVGVRHEIDLDNSTGNIVITASDDSIANAVHYDFDLSAALLAAIGSIGIPTTVVSDTTAKALSLWNGSSNNSPPANWQTPGFVDTSWGNAVVGYDQTVLHLIPIGASSILWPSNPAPAGSVGAQALFREHFTLPAGTIIAANVAITVDAATLDLFLNGVTLGTPANTTLWGGGQFDAATAAARVDISPSVLVAGGANVLAHRVQNDSNPGDYDGGATWVLSVYYATTGGGGGGTLPAGVEGDILYFHNGGWIGLHIGPAFSVLQSNGADPLYGDVPLQWELAGVLEAVRGKANLIPGTGTSLTVVDNPGADRVDVTIGAAPVAGGAVAQAGRVSITIAAGGATNTASVRFAPAFAAAPDVIVSTESGLVIGSAEAITGAGFTARITANVPLAPGASITAVLHWTVGGPSLHGRFKPPLLKSYR